MKGRRSWGLFFAAGAVLAASLGHRASADAPQGRYTIVGDGTVGDTKTGLTWQRTIDTGSYTWANGKNYCAGLSVNGGGWRLPSVGELQTIVDDSVLSSSAIDTVAFPNTQITFWSSSPVAGNSSSAWGVSFVYGHTYTDDITNPNNVRCVR